MFQLLPEGLPADAENPRCPDAIAVRLLEHREDVLPLGLLPHLPERLFREGSGGWRHLGRFGGPIVHGFHRSRAPAGPAPLPARPAGEFRAGSRGLLMYLPGGSCPT